jgi:hypothetical protein
MENEVDIIDADVPQTREAESQVPLGLVSLQMAKARAKLVEECRVLAVNQTEPEDWYDYGGNPGMDVGAAERIRLLFGLQAYDLSVQRDDKVDSRGSFYIITVTGKIGHEREQMDIMGSQTSRKAFYSKSQGEDIDSVDVNEGNVRKDAISNWWTNAISRFLGLRGLTWERIAEISNNRITKDKAKKIDFKSSKAERTPGDDDKVTKIWAWLLEMNGQSVKDAKNQLKSLTAFNDFKGYLDIEKVSTKVLPRLYGKVKGLYSKFGESESDTGKTTTVTKPDEKTDPGLPFASDENFAMIEEIVGTVAKCKDKNEPYNILVTALPKVKGLTIGNFSKHLLGLDKPKLEIILNKMLDIANA